MPGPSDTEPTLDDLLSHTQPKRAADPLIASAARRKLIAFGWYGGKFSHLNWLLPHLPCDADHYCEPFGGSAAVLLNREPAPIETYNDLDGEVVNFFATLRDHTDQLIAAISLTPFSREEFALACGPADNASNIERARRFYVRARQTRTGLAQTATTGRWANCIGSHRRGMAGVVSRWVGGADKLADVAGRLARVQIENRPADQIIRRYDSESTFFYIDPPYLHETRGDTSAYSYEMDADAHTKLADLLQTVAGRAAISGYRAPFMDDHYATWTRIDAPERTIHASKGVRQEALWVNFDPETGKRT